MLNKKQIIEKLKKGTGGLHDTEVASFRVEDIPDINHALIQSEMGVDGVYRHGGGRIAATFVNKNIHPDIAGKIEEPIPWGLPPGERA